MGNEVLITILKNWKLLIGAGLAVTIGLLWLKLQFLENDNAKLKDEANKWQEVAKIEKSSREAWERSAQDLSVNLEKLKENENEARKEIERLSRMFIEHDLQNLLDEKPDTIERLINRGTYNAFRMLECQSGAQRDDCPTGLLDSETSSD